MAASKVVVCKGEDRLALLEQAAAAAGFWEHLEAKLVASKKPREAFVVAIKPNLMIFMTPKVPVVATEPALVEHLVRLLRDRGFRTIKVVESQNTMGNWVRNRTVRNVARVAGYSSDGYEIVDLTEEKVRHVYRVRGLPDWRNWAGKSWRDADYRIDFAKFKTQPDNHFTLCLKNQFGTLPLQDKYWHYHTRLPWWACTLYALASFPVDFCFIDAYTVSDGTAGFAIQNRPLLAKRILASADIIAIDLAGCGIMGLDPWEAPLTRFAMLHLGEPEYTVVGDASPIEEWRNVPEDLRTLDDAGQNIYLISNVVAMMGLLQVDTDAFPPRFPLMRWYYAFAHWLFMAVNGSRLRKHERSRMNEAIRQESPVRR